MKVSAPFLLPAHSATLTGSIISRAPFHDRRTIQSPRHRRDAGRDRILRGLRYLHEEGDRSAATLRGAVPARHRRRDLLRWLAAGAGAGPRDRPRFHQGIVAA